MDRARQRIEVFLVTATIIAALMGGVWSVKTYIEMTYERKTDAKEARVQMQVEIFELLERHHALTQGDLEQLEELRDSRSELMGLK